MLLFPNHLNAQTYYSPESQGLSSERIEKLNSSMKNYIKEN